ELKSKMCPLVEPFFGFESGLNWKIIAKNCQTAEDLKDGKGFVYKHKGMYQVKILQKVVNVMWFRNKQNEGVIHPLLRFHAGTQPISTASAPTISDKAFHAALKEYKGESQTESDGKNGDST
ncbi:hypothetical protein L208DRAFT_1274461, partial [Tricholoma matsutake]